HSQCGDGKSADQPLDRPPFRGLHFSDSSPWSRNGGDSRAVERQGDFGELLRIHRATAGLSQEALAARAGLTTQAISMLERGLRRTPRNSTVLRLADALRLRGSDREALFQVARTVTTAAVDDMPADAVPPRAALPTG